LVSVVLVDVDDEEVVVVECVEVQDLDVIDMLITTVFTKSFLTL